MNNNMEGFRPNESLKIEQNEHGSYDALELGESIKKEGDEMREKILRLMQV